MKIAFYADHHYWGGLANNGGSRTILLSAKTLNEMGHKAVVVTRHDRFTWFKHPKPERKVPKDTDVVVAVSISDVQDMVDGRVRGNGLWRLAYWGRPYETWQMEKHGIYALLRKFDKIYGVVAVNSLWQRDELADCGIASEVIYQGYDPPPAWPEHPCVSWRAPFSIGCQFSSKPRKRWGDFAVLRQRLGDDGYRYVAFGSERCKEKWLDRYLYQPSAADLEAFYRGCHFFFCPNSLEGLYNPGIEAALNGCLLVVSSHRKNGMMDYCDKTTAEMYHLLDEAAQCIRMPHPDRIAACQRRIIEKIGTREHNMRKMVEVLSA